MAVFALVASTRVWRRVVVEGSSMAPALQPGDRLLVFRLPRWARVRRGDVVAARDPRRPGSLVVKRVAGEPGPAGVRLEGDNAAASTDSRSYGPVSRSAVVGVVVYRYAPAERAGRIWRGPGAVTGR